MSLAIPISCVFINVSNYVSLRPVSGLISNPNSVQASLWPSIIQLLTFSAKTCNNYLGVFNVKGLALNDWLH